jgi:hypothetical protein
VSLPWEAYRIGDRVRIVAGREEVNLRKRDTGYDGARGVVQDKDDFGFGIGVQHTDTPNRVEYLWWEYHEIELEDPLEALSRCAS